MQKLLQGLVVFSLVLMFFYNVSGISTCIEHANHAESHSTTKKEGKSNQGAKFSQGDHCQCALHMHMHNVIMPENLSIAFSLQDATNSEIPKKKTTSYDCLLDFFSSRAPPRSFSPAV